MVGTGDIRSEVEAAARLGLGGGIHDHGGGEGGEKRGCRRRGRVTSELCGRGSLCFFFLAGY